MKRLKTLILCCFGLFILAQAVYAQETEKLEVGDPAITFFLRTLEGENFFLSKEIKPDSPIILAFYATWCVPCRQEIPALEALMTDASLKNIRLFYVNVGGLMAADEAGAIVKQREEHDKVLQHKAQFKMTHPILMDRYALTAQKYGVTSLPVTIILGGDGRIKYTHSGYSIGDERKLAEMLNNL